MQTNFIQIQGDKIIVDKGQLITYGLIGAAIIVVLIIAIVAFKHRKKDFIKTIPTNLKEGE